MKPRTLGSWLILAPLLLFATDLAGQEYCIPSFSQVYPICRVQFQEIDRTSNCEDNGSPAWEDFTSDTAWVVSGETYVITVTGSPHFNCRKIYFDWDQSGAFTDSLELGCSGSSTITTATVTIPFFEHPVTARMRVIFRYTMAPIGSCNSGGYGQGEDYTVHVSPPPCFRPMGLGADHISTQGARLYWSPIFSAPSNGYDWELRTSGEAGDGPLGLIAEGSTLDTEVMVNSLSDNTTYRLFVRSDCGADGNSIWIGPYEFTTLCQPVQVPYIEDFEASVPPDLPECITTTVIQGAPWKTGIWQDAGPSTAVSIWSGSGGPAVDAWLFTRQIHLDADRQYRLKWRWRSPNLGSLFIHCGPVPSIGDMVQSLGEYPMAPSNSFRKDSLLFSPVVDGMWSIGFHVTNNSVTSTAFDDIMVEEVHECEGPPAPGQTTGPMFVCEGEEFTLGFSQDLGPVIGHSFQWETSTDGSTWVDAPGNGTSTTYHYVPIGGNLVSFTGHLQRWEREHDGPAACCNERAHGLLLHPDVRVLPAILPSRFRQPGPCGGRNTYTPRSIW